MKIRRCDHVINPSIPSIGGNRRLDSALFGYYRLIGGLQKPAICWRTEETTVGLEISQECRWWLFMDTILSSEHLPLPSLLVLLHLAVLQHSDALANTLSPSNKIAFNSLTLTWSSIHRENSVSLSRGARPDLWMAYLSDNSQPWRWNRET